LGEDGFHLLKDGRRETTIRWIDVRTVRTYKHGFFAYDMICLAFDVGEGEPVEIWEAMVDFMIVAERMREEFPQIPGDWHWVVMLPAFETNDRILWRRYHTSGCAVQHGEAP